jgi:hypothetical protein
VKKQTLIAESGGSKTDWALLENNTVLWRATTISLHPNNWNSENFAEVFRSLKENDFLFSNANLLFFGAGCNSQEKANELKCKIEVFGFENIEIHGDIKAAGIACLGQGTGKIAILGSGSVFIDFQNGEVKQYFGGLGREKGDEGAGFYFGKLVLTALRNKQLESIQESLVKSVLSKTEQNGIERGVISDELCLAMASRLGNYLWEFQNFHRENTDLFYSKYVVQHISIDETLHFVGSYAYFQEEIIKAYFLAKGYQIGLFVPRPIEKLIEFYKTKS